MEDARKGWMVTYDITESFVDNSYHQLNICSRPFFDIFNDILYKTRELGDR
jgi:hypothetical protein